LKRKIGEEEKKEDGREIDEEGGYEW